MAGDAPSVVHTAGRLKLSGGTLLLEHNDAGRQGHLDHADGGAVVAWMEKGQAQNKEARQDNEQRRCSGLFVCVSF